MTLLSISQLREIIAQDSPSSIISQMDSYYSDEQQRSHYLESSRHGDFNDSNPESTTASQSIAQIRFNSQEFQQHVDKATVKIGLPGALGEGSGVIVHRSGSMLAVLTNSHVTDNHDGRPIITTHDGQQWRGTVTYRSDRNDLAVVIFQVSNPQAYEVALLAAESPKQGEWVMAAGYPLEPASYAAEMFIDKRQGLAYDVTVIGPSLGRELNVGGRRGYTVTLESPRTAQGMSGGGIFNERGELAALNGRRAEISFSPDVFHLDEHGRTFGIAPELLRQELAQAGIPTNRKW